MNDQASISRLKKLVGINLDSDIDLMEKSNIDMIAESNYGPILKSKKDQLASVQKNGLSIYYFKNPDLDVQIAAVKENSLAMLYIKNPSPKLFTNPSVKTSVIRTLLLRVKSGETIDVILEYLDRHRVDWPELETIRAATEKKPINESRDPNSMSEEEQVEYVRFNWRDIRHIHNPSERVQRAAVYLDMSALKLIKNPAPSVQKYAILSNSFAFKYIKTVSPEVFSDPEVKHNVIRYLLTLLKSDESATGFLVDLLDTIENMNLGGQNLK